MRATYFVLCMLLCFGTTITAQTSDTLNHIFWSDEVVLKWSDFQDQNAVAGHVSANSHISLPYTISSDGEVDCTIQIESVFERNQSWYHKGKENAILLQHEQLHFDIAEIHRRLIVKVIVEGKFTSENYKEKLDHLIKLHWNGAYRDMQDKYDAETNYSRIFKPQFNWNQLVERQLKELEEFKATSITVTFTE